MGRYLTGYIAVTARGFRVLPYGLRENRVPQGFVTYRLRNNIVGGIILLDATPEAETALWSYCFDIRPDDFVRPLDDPLLWLLANT